MVSGITERSISYPLCLSDSPYLLVQCQQLTFAVLAEQFVLLLKVLIQKHQTPQGFDVPTVLLLC